MRKAEAKIEVLSLDDILIMGGRREVDMDCAKELASTIEAIGLQHPVTVRFVDYVVHPVEGELHGAYILVAGAHRIQAHRILGRNSIRANIVAMSAEEAEMWEISENFHRAELKMTQLQRDEMVGRWIVLKKAISVQVGQKLSTGRPEGGTAAASRSLGISRQDALRAESVSQLSPQAKQAAKDIGLDNNRAALLEAKSSGEGNPEAEVRILRQHAAAQETERSRKADEKENRERDKEIVRVRIHDAADILYRRLAHEEIEAVIALLDGGRTKDLTAALRSKMAGDQPIMDRRYA